MKMPKNIFFEVWGGAILFSFVFFNENTKKGIFQNQGGQSPPHSPIGASEAYRKKEIKKAYTNISTNSFFMRLKMVKNNLEYFLSVSFFTYCF